MLFGRKNMKKLSYLLCTLFAAGFNTSGAFADYCEIVNISYNFPTIVICQDKCSKKRSKKQKKHQKDNVIDIPILGEAEKKDDSCFESTPSVEVELEPELKPEENNKEVDKDNAESIKADQELENQNPAPKSDEESAIKFEQNKMIFKVIEGSNCVSIVKIDPSVSGTVIIPNEAYYEGVSYKVTKIDNNCFEKCADLQLVVIPDTISSIGDNAFAGCSSLKNVVFNDNSSVEVIGDSAFEDSGIVSLILPKSLKSVGKNSFKDCSSLKFVSIENPSLALGIHCFSNCSSLQAVFAPCDFCMNNLRYTGINLDPDSLNFAVVKYSFSKWGLVTEQEVGDGRLFLTHNCSDWVPVEGSSQKMRRCNSCNFLELSEDVESNLEGFLKNLIV